MSYAIVGYFDQDSDRRIKALWRRLAESGVCDYLEHSENRPHFKFAMFDSMDLESVQRSLDLFSKKMKKLGLHFKNYGFYPNDKPIVFIDISATIGIIELQREIQESFNDLGKKTDIPFFDQGVWKPDCFLTIGLEKGKLEKAVSILSEHQLPFNGYLERIGLIEFYPAKQLFSYSLQ